MKERGSEARKLWPESAPLDIGSLKTALFTDLHLHPDRAHEIDDFIDHLERLPADVEALVVMGDLFDAFVGPEQWREPGYDRLYQALGGLRREGIRVILLRGNRDALLDPGDVQALGGEVADGVLCEHRGVRWFVTHGDQFCLRDRPYQRLRWLLRRRWLRAVLRALPYGWRLGLAARMRRVSTQAVARKPLDTMALVEEAVQARLQELGARHLIMGHLHVEERRMLEEGSELRILPAWEPGTRAVGLGASSVSAT